MQSKQVILDKIEYDSMENQLKDLRTILESRTVVTIVERYQAIEGMTIKYILGKDNDNAIQELAAKVNQQVNELQQLKKELSTSKIELRSINTQLQIKIDEINRLNKLKWYHLLMGKK